MRLFILTGAGVSADSGVPTFRDADGLWEGHEVTDVATPEAFARNPELVHRFYNARRAALKTVKPNPAHEALARLEQAFGSDFLLVTQNIDDLHERAGSHRLLHMHGLLTQVRNEQDNVLDWDGDVSVDSRCPKTGTRLRPHVVWFGEVPLYMNQIIQYLPTCTHFAAIGTSGQVYPAAGFASEAFRCGAHTVLINAESTGGDFNEERIGPAAIEVPRWVDEMIAEYGSA
ncbi:MAG: NAD-dependent protein deacylase [Planctomycetota bacterium]|nr:MAG: NAD-dependent protein deacylase [Planctomycetota bacterium]